MIFKSEKTDHLDAALMAMHNEFGVIIPKDRKGHQATYATLVAVLEWITPNAAKHGLKLSQYDAVIDGNACLVSEIAHAKSGQFRAGCSFLTPDPNAKSPLQAWGGATTYQRRYQAMMICGLFCADDETDNDGQHQAPHTSMPQNPFPMQPESTTINDKQYGLLQLKLKENPERAKEVLKKYPDARQIPWKKFNGILKYLGGEAIILE